MKNNESANQVVSPSPLDPEKLKRREALKRMALAAGAAAGSLILQGCKNPFSPYVDNYSVSYYNYSVSYYNYSKSYANYYVYYTNYYVYYTNYYVYYTNYYYYYYYTYYY